LLNCKDLVCITGNYEDKLKEEKLPSAYPAGFAQILLFAYLWQWKHEIYMYR